MARGAADAERKHLSYSQLNAVRQCGESYRLERIEQVPQRPSVPAVAGRVAHEATEAIDEALHRGVVDGSELSSLASKRAAEGFEREIETNSADFPPDHWKVYGKQDLAWFQATGVPNCITAYIDWRLANPTLRLWEIDGFGPAIEVPFELVLGGVLIKGYIDRIFVNDMGVIPVVDIKTGQKPKTDEQLGLYRVAMEVATGHDIRWGVYVYDLKSGEAKQTPPIDLSHWTVDKLSAIYGKANFLIQNQIFLPAPGEQCWRCSVAPHCEFSRAAL